MVGQAGNGVPRYNVDLDIERTYPVRHSLGALEARVFAAHYGRFERNPVSCPGLVIEQGVLEGREVPRAVDRHQGGPESIAGCCQRNGQPDVRAFVGQIAYARHDAAGRYRYLPARYCEAIGMREYRYGPSDCLEVEQRFSHAHEHDVGRLSSEGGQLEVLLDYLVGAEVAKEAKRAGLAECASHGAADLRRQAGRHPAFRIGQQHGLDRRAVAEPQFELDRTVVAGQRLGDRSGEKWLGGQACPFVGGQVAHVGEGSGSPGYPLECLAAAEGGLQGESIRQLRGQKSGGRYVAARLVHLHLFWIWAMSSWMCGLRMPKRMNSWSVSSAFRFSPVAR